MYQKMVEKLIEGLPESTNNSNPTTKIDLILEELSHKNIYFNLLS